MIARRGDRGRLRPLHALPRTVVGRGRPAAASTSPAMAPDGLVDRCRRSADRIRSPVAVVLAGGRSSRMGGGDKSLRAARRPAAACARASPGWRRRSARIAISANGDPARFDAFGLPVLADTIAGYLGPLAGMLAGMQWAARPRRDPYSQHADRHAVLSGRPRRLARRSAAGRRTHRRWPPRTAGAIRPSACGRSTSPAGSRDFLLAGATYKVSAFADACDAVVGRLPDDRACRRAASIRSSTSTASDDLALAETLLAELEAMSSASSASPAGRTPARPR